MLKTLPIALAIAALLSGCASLDRATMKPVTPTSVNGLKTHTDNNLNASNQVDLDADVLPEDVFVARSLAGTYSNSTQGLPSLRVPPMHLSESGAIDAIRIMLRKTGISVAVEGNANDLRKYGGMVAMDISGDLPEVIDKISRIAGFFFNLSGGVLKVTPEQQFVVSLPPVLNDDNMAGIHNTIQYMGAQDVYLDRVNKMLSFRANRVVHERIAEYLEHMRQTRSMIIYDVQVYQVTLKDTSSTGIQWNQLTYSKVPGMAADTLANGSSAFTTTDGAALAPALAAVATRTNAGGLGLVLAGKLFALDTLVEFLETQGSVKALSKPRIGMINGSRSRFRVGTATTYVSAVGTNYSTSVNSVTTETQNLRTGIEVALSGDIDNGTVYSKVRLSISELVRMNQFTALGTTLKLPETQDREVETVLRARPGDLILIGGIVMERDSATATSGVMNNGKAGDVERTELVLAMQPKVVRFVSAAKPASVKKATSIEWVTDKVGKEESKQ